MYLLVGIIQRFQLGYSIPAKGLYEIINILIFQGFQPTPSAVYPVSIAIFYQLDCHGWHFSYMTMSL